MHVLPLVVAVVAAVAFGWEAARTRRAASGNLVAAGLCLLTIAWILASIIRADDNLVTWTW